MRQQQRTSASTCPQKAITVVYTYIYIFYTKEAEDMTSPTVVSVQIISPQTLDHEFDFTSADGRKSDH